MNTVISKLCKVGIILAVIPLAVSGCVGNIGMTMATSAATTFATAIAEALAQLITGSI